MLPRLNMNVHPLNSLSSTCPDDSKQTTFRDKIAEFTGLPFPSALPHDSEWKWYYNYPRFYFIVLFIACTFIGGIYVSSQITTWTLDVLGVHNKLTTAREEYAATSHMLNTMTQCVNRSSLEYLAVAKLQFEADSKRVQKIIDANDKILADKINATMTCEFGRKL